MAKFSYIAKAQDGSTKTGFITGYNEDIVLSTLQSKGLIVVSLKDANQKSVFGQDLEIFNRVSERDLAILTRILALFLEVQIPLVEGFSILREQNKKNKYLTQVLDQVIIDLQDGNLLSDALAKHPKVFGKLYVSMVRSGEVSGGLQDALSYMANYLEEQYDLNSKVKGALSYPVFVLLVFALIGLGVAYYVLPQLVEVLENIGTGAELPWTTQLIILMSNILQNYIWLILIVIVSIVGSFIYFLRTEAGGKWADKWELKLPVFGKLLTKIYVARFSNNMETLLQGGVPIISALEISSEVVGNTIFSNIIKDSIEKIKAGGQLSDGLIEHKEFPYIATQIISVGEKTGKITSVLETLARFYKKEVDNLIANLTVLIEPILIVALGIGVAIFVVSILMPIYNIAGTL